MFFGTDAVSSLIFCILLTAIILIQKIDAFHNFYSIIATNDLKDSNDSMV